MNLFANLISDNFKSLHQRMIDGMLEPNKCTVKCILKYQSTKFNDCSNCIYDAIGGKSSNRFQSGGPVPFHHGVCPVCNGAGKIINIEQEIVYSLPIWDSKDWINVDLNQISTAKINVQLMNKIDDYTKLKRATSLTIDSSVTNLGIPDFVRVGDPEICGFGGSDYIISSWKRAG